VNAIALTFDPRRPDLARVAEALAEAPYFCRNMTSPVGT